MSRRVLLGEDWQPPQDPISRRLLYIKYVVLGNTQDALRVREAIARLSGISEAQVERVEASFRREIQKPAD